MAMQQLIANAAMRTTEGGQRTVPYGVMASAAIQKLRDLDMLNERAFDLLKHEGQYEATRPSRYVFKEKTE